MPNLSPDLVRYEKLLHQFQFRDKIKSAEYHFAIPFEFDGFFEDRLIGVIFEKMQELVRDIEFTTFKIGVAWPKGVDEAEKSHLRFSLQTPLITLVREKMGKQDNFSSADVEYLIDFGKNLVCVRIAPVYIKGKYCKFSRELAQTEFFCNKCRGQGCWYCNNTGHFSKNSVEQILDHHIVPAFGAKLAILHGAGREDMDVLMLGKGRPFVLELLMPLKRSADLSAIQKEINHAHARRVAVSDFEITTVQNVSETKEKHHEKVYAALIIADKDIDTKKIPFEQKIVVQQQTPLRVARRRADLVREKVVYVQRIGEITAREFVLVMRTSHGTYVKEFISGDSGRTNPSISSLVGAQSTCRALDVLEICD